MGLLDWLKSLLFESPPPPPSRPQPETRAPSSADRPFSAPAAKKPAPQNKTLNLDAGAFTPLSAEDAKKQARGLRWNLASVNFDRRDHIPAPTEPRTLLIDRAMVAQGLLTPEQLVEIH